MTGPEDVDALVADLERAAAAYDDAVEAVEAVGERDARAVADAVESADRLLDRYAETATGSGDFQAYVEFRESFDDAVEALDDDLPRRSAFEEAADCLDRRRLSASDFERARDALGPAREVADLLDERVDARSRYGEARHAVLAARDDLAGRADDLARLLELGEADLDAPVGDLREAVGAYDDAVRSAFEAFERSASAREVLGFVADTDAYPLVEFRQPPANLLSYVRGREAGTEPIPTLVEYADYSRSKLSHYVDDPGELKRAVATNLTYLQRLDGDPLTVGWPPPAADRLRWRVRELVSVVDRFAPESVLEHLREVRSLAFDGEYERLRQAAIARDELGDEERARLRRGEVEPELRRVRAALAELADVLAEYPER